MELGSWSDVRVALDGASGPICVACMAIILFGSLYIYMLYQSKRKNKRVG